MVIERRETHGDDVAVLTIVSTDGKPLPDFEAGAHVDVHITDKLIRQYSLAGDPDNASQYRLGILNDPESRGGSAAVFDQFTEGHKFTISHPRNLFPLDATAEKSILIAGGIGVTPILSMAYALRRINKPFEIHYCLRDEQKGAFKQELIDEFGDAVHFYYNTGDGRTSMDPRLVMTPVSPTTHIYMCGPGGFLDWLLEQAENQGYSSRQCHFEFFNAEVARIQIISAPLMVNG